MTKHIRNGHDNGHLKEERLLLDYLNGELSGEEAHLLESAMAEDPFLKDAIEGLSALPDKKQLQDSVLLLQKQLKTQVHARKKRHQHYLKPKLWLWLAALVVIIIVMAAWWVLSLAKFQ